MAREPRPQHRLSDRRHVRLEDALLELDDVVLLQHERADVAWRARHVDPVRGRILLARAPGSPAAVAPGAACLLAETSAGAMEVPGRLEDADETSATFAFDPDGARFEPRRNARRHALELEVRDPAGAWRTTTSTISQDAAELAEDVPLADGDTSRVTVGLGTSEVELLAAVSRRDGAVILRFDAAQPATRRALGQALLRLRRRAS